MYRFEMKQLNSLTFLIALYKECLIDSLFVCEIWCFLNYHNNIEVDTENVTRICICRNNNVIAYN